MRPSGTRRKITRALTAVAFTGAALLGTAVVSSPAHADWDKVTCNINPVTGIKLTKKCRAIPAHRSQHWVWIDVKQVARFTEWWVTDLDTGVVVGHGTGSKRDHKIPGLYGERYQLKVYGYGTNATAANYL
ncbi:hypothetical protein [Micromonospora psammae]|uniref:hypothetical protein n=1 Tax=Micromonospora sp. CPCC 205556 TaxID=3122398 RepID=UPI002FEF1571